MLLERLFGMRESTEAERNMAGRGIKQKRNDRAI